MTQIRACGQKTIMAGCEALLERMQKEADIALERSEYSWKMMVLIE
jgi:hypothetical protein